MEYNSDIDDYVVFVNGGLWDRVKEGDREALEEAQAAIDGLVIYFHIIHPNDGEVAVSIDDLIRHNVVNSITLHKGIA